MGNFARASKLSSTRKVNRARLAEERKLALRHRWFGGALATLVAGALVFTGMTPAVADELPPETITTTEAATEEAPPPTEEPPAVTEQAPPAEAAPEVPAEQPAPSAEQPVEPVEPVSPQSSARTAPQQEALAAPEETVALAACPTPWNGFEIDGNIPVDCAPANDWASVPAAVGTSYGVYKPENENVDPATWRRAPDGTSPAKADIREARSWATTSAGGDPLLFVSWTRASQTGSGGFSVEVTKAPQRFGADGQPQPDRSQGGTVFFFDQNGNTTIALVATCTYGPSTYPAAEDTVFDNCDTSTPGANEFAGATDGIFFEVGLNLALLANVVPGCPPTFGSAIYVRGSTGNNDPYSANIQSWVGPMSVTPPSTCKPLTATKTAVPAFSRDYDWSIDKSVDKTSANVIPNQNATFAYKVKVTPSAPQDSNFTVSGVITVTNPNPVEVPLTSVTDVIPNANCVITTSPLPAVPANTSVNLNYTCTMPAGTTATSAGTNTATVNWGGLIGNGSTQATAGFNFANATPTVTDASVVVSDTASGVTEFGAPKTVTKLDGPTEFSYTRSLGSDVAAGSCKDYPNVASVAATSDQAQLDDSVTVQVCAGANLTIEKNVIASLTRTYPWTIDKRVDQTTRVADAQGNATFNYTVEVTRGAPMDSNWAMSGTIKVNNPNAWAVDVTVTDLPSFAGVTCVVPTGTNATIPAKTTVDFAYTCTFPATGPFIVGTNKATVTWDASKAFTSASSAEYTVAINEVNWTKTLVNASITVIDDKTVPGNQVVLGTTDKSATFTYALTLKGVPGKCVDFTNTAWIQETNQSDTQKVTVCDYDDLTVTKTADPTFDRKYNFDLDKKAEDTSLVAGPGGTVTAKYTVTVTDLAAEDSNFKVSGFITVTNPNAVAVPLQSLTDKIGSTVCTVALPQNLSVPANSSLEVQYTCALGSATASTTGTNTASVTWDQAALAGTSGAASGTKDFSFANAVITDKNAKTITVLDNKTKPDAEAVELGTHTWTSPGTEQEYTYELQLAGTPGDCVTYDNRAWIKNTSIEATESVEVCAYQDLTVSKTAVGTFSRDYDWDITKVASDDAVTVEPNKTAPIGYSVKVTPTAAQDSDFTVTGVITVKNPNALNVTITLVDTLPGANCQVTGTSDLLIEAGETRTFPYVCALPGATAATNVTNTVDITWSTAVLPLTSGSAKATAGVNFAQVSPATTDATATVTDSVVDLKAGTLNAADGPKTFTYTRDLGTAPGTCTTYPNTATVTPTHETASSADASVEVCSPTIDKTMTSAVQSPQDADRWTLTYEITVNLAGGVRQYDLGDDPAFATGVNIVSGSAQRISPEPAGPVIDSISQAGAPFVTDVTIGGGGNTTHVYRVTWVVDIPGTVQATACDGANTGFYNTGILKMDGVTLNDADCKPVIPKVYPKVTKTVSDISRDPDTKQWEIEYTLEVKQPAKGEGNPEGVASKYTLKDTLDYGVIDVVDASWSGEGTLDKPFQHVGDVWSADIATNKTIAAGATHTYVVTVHATLTKSDLQGATIGCTRTGQTSELGFFNDAVLSFGEGITPQVVEACTPPVYPTITKVVDPQPHAGVDPETGLQRVSYLVTVTSPAVVGDDPVTNVLYSLTERPDALPGNVDLVGEWHAESVGADTPGVTEATWDGTGDWLLKGLGVFSAQDRSAGKLVHVYRIWADVLVTAQPAGTVPTSCPQGEPGGIAIWNEVALTFGEQDAEVRACDEVEFHDVGIDKTATNLPVPPEGMPLSVEPGDEFDYELTVTNYSAGDATDVTVTDPLIDRLEVTGVTLPAGWTNVNAPEFVDEDNMLEFHTDTMAVGTSVTIVVSVRFLPADGAVIFNGEPTDPAVPLEQIDNEACVAAAIDQDPTNDCDEVTIETRDIAATVYTRCVNDAPLLGWTIVKSSLLEDSDIEFLWEPVNPDVTPETNPAFISLTQPGGTSSWSNEIAWPGAVFNGDRISIDYPGWRPLQGSDYTVDGQYIDPADGLEMTAEEVSQKIFNGLILDDSELDYAWRGNTEITFSVNPELTFTTSYPPATPECFVARHTEVQIEKTASVEKTDPGKSFTYTLDVANVSTDSAAAGVVVTDTIPTDIKITDVSWPGEGDEAVFPNWESCEVTGQNTAGYGGTLECVLFGPLQPLGANEGASAAPSITLSATVNPAATASTITNVAVVDYHTFDDPEDVGRDTDDAIVALSALPATGGGVPLPLALLGMLALLGGVTTLVISRRRRGDAKPVL